MAKNLGQPLNVGGGGTGVSIASANQVFAGPASGSPTAPAFRSLVNADVVAGLGYQPARPNSNVSGSLGNTSNVTSSGTILGSVTLTATAATMLFLGDAYFQSTTNLQNGALYLQINNSGGSAVATGHQSVQACPASTYTQISTFLIASGLTIGATYTIYLLGVNSTATNTMAVNNAYISGVNL